MSARWLIALLVGAAACTEEPEAAERTAALEQEPSELCAYTDVENVVAAPEAAAFGAMFGDDPYGGGGGGPAPTCTCDTCNKCTQPLVKLCQTSPPPSGCANWQFTVALGNWPSCAAISANGGTTSGYDHYGGTHNCALKNCR